MNADLGGAVDAYRGVTLQHLTGDLGLSKPRQNELELRLATAQQHGGMAPIGTGAAAGVTFNFTIHETQSARDTADKVVDAFQSKAGLISSDTRGRYAGRTLGF